MKNSYICNLNIYSMRKITNQELGRPTIEEFSKQPKMAVTVVLDNIRSLQNVGSIFRSCDAFGAERMMLCGITATPPARDIHKTALGAELSVEWSYFKTTMEAIEQLKDEGYTIVAIEQVEGAAMLHEFKCDPAAKYAVVMGNEVMGVDDEVVDMCDTAIEIPQVGTKHSINVSVAGGVVLWNFFCQITLNE